jgi:hypothetical protein
MWVVFDLFFKKQFLHTKQDALKHSLKKKVRGMGHRERTLPKLPQWTMCLTFIETAQDSTRTSGPAPHTFSTSDTPYGWWGMHICI